MNELLEKHIRVLGDTINTLPQEIQEAVFFICGMVLADLPPDKEAPLTDILFGRGQ